MIRVKSIEGVVDPKPSIAQIRDRCHLKRVDDEKTNAWFFTSCPSQSHFAPPTSACLPSSPSSSMTLSLHRVVEILVESARRQRLFCVQRDDNRSSLPHKFATGRLNCSPNEMSPTAPLQTSIFRFRFRFRFRFLNHNRALLVLVCLLMKPQLLPHFHHPHL